MLLHSVVSLIPVALNEIYDNSRECEDQTEEEKVGYGLHNFSIRFKADFVKCNQAAHADE